MRTSMVTKYLHRFAYLQIRKRRAIPSAFIYQTCAFEYMSGKNLRLYSGPLLRTNGVA